MGLAVRTASIREDIDNVRHPALHLVARTFGPALELDGVELLVQRVRVVERHDVLAG